MQAAYLIAFNEKTNARKSRLTTARLQDLARAPFSHPGEPSPARRWGSAATPVCHTCGLGQPRSTTSQS